MQSSENDHDDLVQRLRRAHRMSCSDPDDPTRTTLYSEAAAALKARPTLAVRGEEELWFRANEAERAERCRVAGCPERVAFVVDGGSCGLIGTCARHSDVAANGTVQVVPLLVESPTARAASREEVARMIFENTVRDWDGANIEGRDYLAWKGCLSAADALLAPGGPVQVADATPEQGWAEAVEHAQSRIRASYPDWAERNPYDGFTRREQTGGE